MRLYCPQYRNAEEAVTEKHRPSAEVANGLIPLKMPPELGGVHQTVNRHSGIMNCAPCLSLWERWLSEAKTERGSQWAAPSQSPSVTALPKGEPRGCDTLHSLLYDHPLTGRRFSLQQVLFQLFQIFAAHGGQRKTASSAVIADELHGGFYGDGVDLAEQQLNEGQQLCL